jgi:predicted phage terminase large subunit-like protein
MSQKRRLEALLRNDYRAFLTKAFHTLSPGQDYVSSWALDALAEKLERVRRGETQRLIVNMPPRSLKSIASSVAFPAFALGHDPTLRLICVSYSGELAKKHSNDFRALISAPWYKDLFPGMRVGRYKDSETEIETSQRGYRLATSLGGTLTGRGGDIIIIDDPLKPDEAQSDSRRNTANNWFTNTLLSRLDNKLTGAIIIVMQRVHIDDLTGFVLSQSDEWEVLSLPAIAQNEQDIPTWAGAAHRRLPGDVLYPEREPIDILNELKQQIGGDAFNAQYQQEPVPPGGAMIKRVWVQRYSELPPRSERLFVLQSWDTASKGGPENDWSVCTTWLFARPKRYYLLDVFRGRFDYPELKANVQAQARKWQANRVLVEDTGTGTSLVQELRGHVSGIVAIRPERDKISRMSVASAKFESGRVFLPRRAPWLPDLEAELFAFPAGRHDDQCDSVSQALQETVTSFWEWLTPEDASALLAEIKANPYRRRFY